MTVRYVYETTEDLPAGSQLLLIDWNSNHIPVDEPHLAPRQPGRTSWGPPMAYLRAEVEPSPALRRAEDNAARVVQLAPPEYMPPVGGDAA